MTETTFKDIAAQGELTIFRIDALPVDIVPMEIIDGRFIIGHSETGHHHVIDVGPEVEAFVQKTDATTMFLNVLAADVQEKKVRLRHERNHDTHAALTIAPGLYQINVSREYGLTAWHRVVD